jgi:two-component system response regulator YesN
MQIADSNAPLRALIVEDDAFVRRETRRLDAWGRHGIFIVGDAEDGSSALRFLETHPVDILFTDLSMPGFSGMEYLREIRRRFPDLDIVVLTIHRDFELIQEAMRLGVDDYITKEQFDRKNIDGILTSLLSRIRNRPGERCYTSDSISCLYYPDGAPGGQRFDENFALFEQTGSNPAPPSGSIKINTYGVMGINYRQLLEYLRRYVAEELFYLYEPDRAEYFYYLVVPPPLKKPP